MVLEFRKKRKYLRLVSSCWFSLGASQRPLTFAEKKSFLFVSPETGRKHEHLFVVCCLLLARRTCMQNIWYLTKLAASISRPFWSREKRKPFLLSRAAFCLCRSSGQTFRSLLLGAFIEKVKSGELEKCIFHRPGMCETNAPEIISTNLNVKVQSCLDFAAEGTLRHYS